jgi:hypothetical protein
VVNIQYTLVHTLIISGSVQQVLVGMCQQEIKDVVWNVDALNGCYPAKRADPTNKHIKSICEDADAMYNHMDKAWSNELPDDFHTLTELLLTTIGLPAGLKDPEDLNPLEDAVVEQGSHSPRPSGN